MDDMEIGCGIITLFLIVFIILCVLMGTGIIPS